VTPRVFNRKSEQGLALVSVLWAISILSLIAANMIASGSISAAIERNALRQAEADAIAESAIVLAILGLSDTRPGRRWRVDGVPTEFEFDGTRIAVRVQDVLGLIDINEADSNLLTGLFRGAGLTPAEASRLAGRIIDWRSAGDLKSLDGANRADYRDAGLSYVPRDGPFQSVEELQLVLGMTTEIFTRIAPALTVHSHQPGFDVRIAPRQALLALSSSNGREADRQLANRLANAGTLNSQGIALPAGTIDPSLSLNGRVFAIEANFLYRGARIKKTQTIRVTADPMRPYLVLDSD
jgi:general secretion pathway protein K